MTYTFKQNLVASNKYSIKCPHEMTPKYVVCHNTANDAPATNEISYMIGNDNEVSFHIAVDDVNAIQGLPLDRNAWACGDGGRGQGNRYGISVEICYSLSGGSKYTAAEENAVYVMARLLYKYGLGIEALKQHHNFATNGKNCPHRIRDEKRWDGFKGRVEWVLQEIQKGNIEAALESGTTELKQTPVASQIQSSTVKWIEGEWKIKVLVDTNLWLDTNYQQVGGRVIKGEELYVTKMSECGQFFLVDGKYLANSHTLNYVTNMWLEPQGKIQLKQDCNLWSYANYDVVVGQVKAWEIYEYIDYKNGMYQIPYKGWVSEAFVNKKLSLADAQVTV